MEHAYITWMHMFLIYFNKSDLFVLAIRFSLMRLLKCMYACRYMVCEELCSCVFADIQLWVFKPTKLNTGYTCTN